MKVLADTRLFYAAVVLSILPLWLVTYLPMVDLPQHAAQVAAWRELLAGNDLYRREFETNWFTPYLLGYVLYFAFSSVLSYTMAAKLVVTISVAAVPVLTDALLAETGGERRLRWLAIPGALGFAFYFGLLSFLCAVPLGLFLLLLTIRYERSPTFGRGLSLAAVSVALFFSHLLVLGIMTLASAAYVIAARFDQPRTWWRQLAPLAAAAPLILVWGFVTYGGEHVVRDTAVRYSGTGEQLQLLFGHATGIDLFQSWPVNLIGFLMFVAPALLGCRLTTDYSRYLPFACAAIIYFRFPALAFGTAFLYHRFSIFLLPLWLLAWNAPAEQSTPRASYRLAAITVVSVIVSISIFNAWRFRGLQSQSHDFTAIVQQIPEGKRVLSVVRKRYVENFQYPVLLHHATWYQPLRGGIVDFNFAYFYPQLVRYRPGRQVPVDERFVSLPYSRSFEQINGAAYDYFIFLADEDEGYRLFGEHGAGIDLVAQQGPWWLYRGDDPN
ncbi:MAG: hypothetical protein KJO54_08265 [Gammaproteobacteria bacterium]|nr:hypothetical protein [Gammaproteobacteria bacterium]NNF60196.1 hypothetical protein [Gammaproteobacteria bacterium]NNM21609.1 hypothetical protein [Gammaproteobacteria bacterium]